MSGHVGMDSINREAFDSLSASFGQFVADGHVKDSTIVKTGTGINALRAGSGDFRGNVFFRSARQIEENNAVRTAFLKSVSDVYGDEDHIPESVRKAMKASDFDGKGHPLTARRIRATMDAIRTDIDHKKIADVVESQEWLQGDYVDVLKNTRPDLINKLRQYTDKLASDIFDVMKTTILHDIEKGKAPSVAKMRHFLEAANRENPETQNILSSDNGNLEREDTVRACWDAAFNKALVRNETLMKFFFNDSKVAAEASRNLTQAYEEIRDSFDLNVREEADAYDDFNRKAARFEGRLFMTRHFVVVDLTPNEILSLLNKMVNEQGRTKTESDKKVLTLMTAIDVIRMLPNAEQRAVVSKFYRQIGQSILDGTIRARKPSGEDALYDVLIKKELLNEIVDCGRNCKRNAKAGNHDLPETIMGSPELDEQLKQRLTELKAQI